MRRFARGFTLLEVMIGLALLGFALAVLIKSAAGNIFNAQQAQMIGVVTDLSRGKMYDVEEGLLKDGFQDTDQNSQGAFDNEGWPLVTWTAKVEEVELPSWKDLQAMATGHAKKMMGSNGSAGGFGSGSAIKLGSNGLPLNLQDLGSAFGSGSAGDIAAILGSDALGAGSLNAFQNSALGSMLGQFGGLAGAGFGSDTADSAGANLIQQQYSLVQQVLKVSIRKVTLVVSWKVGGDANDLKTVAFFTDAAAMDKVLQGLGATGSASGSDSGSGSTKGPGTGSGTTRTSTSTTGLGTGSK